MLQQIFLSIVGFCSGIIIAGGVVGLLIGLSIVPRYAGITHTGKHILLYEDITLLGIVCGNLFFLYGWHIPGGTFALLLYGLFSGISGTGKVPERTQAPLPVTVHVAERGRWFP